MNKIEEHFHAIYKIWHASFISLTAMSEQCGIDKPALRAAIAEGRRLDWEKT